MATNFLKFFSIGSDGVAFKVGASGVDCVVGAGSMCTGRGLFLGLVVALGSKYMGIG